MTMPAIPQHPGFPQIPRRVALQAGGIGLLGLGMNHVSGLQAMADLSEAGAAPGKHKSVIYIFLSGGLAQHESFDPKPLAPDPIRGEFSPIATQTSGVHISEHLPMLAAMSNKWSMVRSLTHPYNEHSIGHHVMLTGRTETPRGFNGSKPTANDYPSIPSVVSGVVPRKNNLPPAAVLPEKLIHVTGRTIPGQFAGQMGPKLDPWFIEASGYKDSKYIHGAFPEYGFQRWDGATCPDNYVFEAPKLTLQQGILEPRFRGRLDLMNSIDAQRRFLDKTANIAQFDQYRQEAVSLLLDGGVHRALDVHSTSDDVQERYGKNSFGWSCLMARQLVEAGVSLTQVNLGYDDSADTHESAFYHLKNFLRPPTSLAV
ncbi:MAG: DUF1501 domain-containing protein, partial [Planctomycetes bacterium]|nr:DUF1501 domain-containing protein [Planctomycetota bacterium]